MFITQAPTTTTTIPLPTLPITVPGETTTLVPGFADGSTTTVAGGPQTYTVKANDTVLRIAQRFGVDAQALADYNHWSDGITHPIYPGTVIGIPAKTTTVTTTAVGGSGGVPSVTTTIAPGAGSTYTVKANDTVVGIARKYGITAQTLARGHPQRAQRRRVEVAVLLPLGGLAGARRPARKHVADARGPLACGPVTSSPGIPFSTSLLQCTLRGLKLVGRVLRKRIEPSESGGGAVDQAVGLRRQLLSDLFLLLEAHAGGVRTKHHGAVTASDLVECPAGLKRTDDLVWSLRKGQRERAGGRAHVQPPCDC